MQITSKNKIEGNKFVWNSSCVIDKDENVQLMKMIRRILGAGFLLTLSAMMSMASTQDSIGTKVKNGKIYILHKVEKSQGLFAISRRYGVPLNDIIVANPGSDKILHVDQILLIPTGKDAALEEKAVTEYFAEDKVPSQVTEKTSSKKTTFAKYHTVASGETLYSISVLYKTKVDVIKDLNGLESDVLSTGQQLMVPATEDEKEDQDKKLIESKQKLDDAKEQLEEIKETVKPKKLPEDPAGEKAVVTKGKYTVSVEKVAKYNSEKVSETGFVETYDKDVTGPNKRVCSHHSASIGSTVMVTNPSNNKSVFVKVVANHDINESKGNIIQLSKTALSDIEISDNAAIHVSFAR